MVKKQTLIKIFFKKIDAWVFEAGLLDLLF